MVFVFELSHLETLLVSVSAARRGEEYCYGGDVCPERMLCRDGRCRCAEEAGDSMTDDGRFCLRPHERLLGQACDPHTDVCYHITGVCHASSAGITFRPGGAERRDGLGESCSCRLHCGRVTGDPGKTLAQSQRGRGVLISLHDWYCVVT